MAKRPLLVDILARLGGILAAAFQLVGGLFKLVDLSVRQVAWIAFVFVLGLLLLWLRFTFFDIAPSIASSANDWAVGFNALIGTVDALMIVVEAITSLIASLIGGQPTFTAIPFVSAQTLQELATELPAACGPINNAGLVLDVLIRPAASPSVCPVVRYMRPTWVYPILEPLTDALALSYDPEPFPGNNCACNQYCEHEIACVILGSGYLVMEVLLPLLLLGLLASSLLGPLFRLIWRVLRLGLKIAVRAVDFIAAKVLDPILERILP